MNCYKLVEDTEGLAVYEYRTVCSYWLYGTIFFMLASIELPEWFALIPPISILVYLIVVFLPSRETSRFVKQSMRTGGISLHGSRWSFSAPLKITIPKAVA